MDESAEQAVPPNSDEPQSKWPKVIGIISLIYALIGLTCTTTEGIWLGVSGMLPEMWRGGADPPRIIQVTGIAQVVLTLGVGILMVTGAVSLLRRRRSGPGLLKKWVLLRMALLVLAVVAMVLTGPAQTQMQRSILEFQNDMFREADMTDRIVEKTDEELWQKAMLQGGIAAGLFAIYPVFLGLYLSRKKITAEVELWG